MKLIYFSLKKTLKTPLYLVFLLAILLLPPFFYALGRQIQPLPAAYFLEESADTEGRLLARYLEEAGFIPYQEEAQMRRDIGLGRLEGGVVIPAGLSEKLANQGFEEALVYISSATALLPDLWINHTVSALCAVYAPYITASVLQEAQIPQEEVLDTFREMMEEEKLFRFELSTREGILIPDQARSRRFFLGTLSLLLFLGTYFCVSAPLMESARDISIRIGRSKAITLLYMPSLLLRGAGLLLAAAGACLLAREEGFILPLAGALPAMLLFHSLLGLLPGGSRKDLLIIFIALFSLALSPMYMDLSLLLPSLGILRLLLPPCWLWFLAGML